MHITNIEIKQGATVQVDVALTDDAGAALDMTGYTLRGQIRATAQSADVAAEFACAWTDAASGKGVAVLDQDTTGAIPLTGATVADVSRLSYDIFVISPLGETTLVAEGYAVCRPRVTR